MSESTLETAATKSPSVDRRLFAELGPARRALRISIITGVLVTLSVVIQMLALAKLLSWAMAGSTHPFPASACVAFVLALVARVIFGGIGEAVAASSSTSVTFELRRRLLAHVVATGPQGLVDQRNGSLVLGATRGLRSLEPYFSRYLPAAVVAAFAPFVALGVLALLDWPSALLALALAALVPFAMIRLGRRAATESDRQWRRLSSMSARFLELLRGIPTLRALGAVSRGRRDVIAANEAVSASVNATLRAAMTSSAALEFLAGVGVGLVAMLAGLRLLHGSFSLAGALAVLLITPEVFLPLRRAGAEFHASAEGRSAAAEIFAALDLATSEPSSVQTDVGRESIFPVVLRDGAVGYDDVVFPAVSFTLHAHSALLIEGPSGSGKTTLLKTMCGFLPLRDGTLSFGGADGQILGPTTLRHRLSFVPQSPHVFARSLRFNLTLGAAHDDEQLFEALSLVGLRHLALPELGGLSRNLGEGGHTISAGERSRLGLARAVMQDRSLVLLDEPTAHLDEATILSLRFNLRDWLSKRTVVEVAHRTSVLDPTSPRLFMEGLR